MRKLMLAFALALCGAQAFAQTNTGVIEGRIVNAVTQEPVPNVQITLIAPPPNNLNASLSPDVAAQLATQTASLIESGIRAGVSQDAIDNAVANLQRNLGGVAAGAQTAITANNEGRFIIKDLAPGRYTVRATREGYFGPPVNGNAPALVTKTVNVTAGATALVDFALTQGGIISGRVRDPNGQAVSGLQVSAYRVTYTQGRKTWSAMNSKATDDRGEYRMFWLPPGEYYVGVTPRAPGTVPGPQDSWSRTFFPSVTEPSSASLIVINKGGETTGIDINIRTATSSVFKISGVARNPYVRPNPTTNIADQSISSFILAPRETSVLDAANPPSVQNALPINARPNGEFEIRNVRPGAYDLIPYYLDSPQVVNSPGTPAVAPLRRYMVSHNPVEVRNADVTGLTLSIHPGVNLSGEVQLTGSGPQPLKLESLRIGLRGIGTLPQAFASISALIQVDASGKFQATGVPQDRYVVAVTGMPATAFISDVRQSGVSVFDAGFVLDDNPNPLQIVLDAGGVQVDGTVLSADRKPAAGATVVLVPAEARRQNALLYKSAQTSDSGGFTMRGVAPGPYTIYAWENIPATAWQNAEFMSGYEGRGRPLTVGTQSPLQVEVPLIPVETKN